MVEDCGGNDSDNNCLMQELLMRVQGLVPAVLQKAREVKGFSGRWKMIISKVDQIPRCLSDLSSHPFFSRNSLCKEQLEAVSKTLNEVTELTELCDKESHTGKLQMQSHLDALIGKLDLNLHDCKLLMKTSMLGEVASPCSSTSTTTTSSSSESEGSSPTNGNIRELLARLQIGNLEAKHRALDKLVELMKEDEKSVLTVLKRSNVTALVQLLTATSPRIREATVTIICSLAESGSSEILLLSEIVLPPLIRLLESGNTMAREKSTFSLQRMSMSLDTARSIVGHGGVRPLVEICDAGDSVTQAAAACTLKNLSAVPEVRQILAEEGTIKVMINLLDCGILLGSKEYAAECILNFTSSNDKLRRCVISEGGVQSLLAYLEGPLPQESAVAALRNLIPLIPSNALVSAGIIHCLVHVLRAGSIGAQQAAASAICLLCSSLEVKKLVGEAGCIPLLIKMLGAKTNSVREVAAQGLSSLMSIPLNRREVKKDEMSVPNLVQLLEPSPQNSAKKYAVSCLVFLSWSKRCKKLMVSYGAIGYLKKLSEMEVQGAKKLLERLERGRLRSLFSRK